MEAGLAENANVLPHSISRASVIKSTQRLIHSYHLNRDRVNVNLSSEEVRGIGSVANDAEQRSRRTEAAM